MLPERAEHLRLTVGATGDLGDDLVRAVAGRGGFDRAVVGAAPGEQARPRHGVTDP
ncbi:hypothetical protein ACWC9U_22230 [Streptomyces sp. 900116325]